VNSRHLSISDFDADRVRRSVAISLRREPGAGGGRADEVDHRGASQQRAAAPVLTNGRKQPMLDLVPLAGA
jgi:hypothetical protein